MIGLEDRQALARDIEAAHAAGARLQPACEIAGIELRTLQRWKARQGLTAGDGRPQAVRPSPNHALSAAERVALLTVANEPRFASVPPARIVPMLADEGVYLGSAQGLAPAHHPHRHGPWPRVVLDHELPAGQRHGPVVPPVPDPGFVPPQDHWSRGA